MISPLISPLISPCDQSTDQSTRSLHRVTPPRPTDGLTYERTYERSFTLRDQLAVSYRARRGGTPNTTPHNPNHEHHGPAPTQNVDANRANTPQDPGRTPDHADD